MPRVNERSWTSARSGSTRSARSSSPPASCCPASYFLIPGGTPQSVLYDAVGIASALAIGLGVALNRPQTRLPWLLFGLGNLSFAGRRHRLRHRTPTPPVPSIADWFYLAGYPLLAVGLGALVFRAGGHHRFAALVEAAIVTVAFALFQWVFVVDRHRRRRRLRRRARRHCGLPVDGRAAPRRPRGLLRHCGLAHPCVSPARRCRRDDARLRRGLRTQPGRLRGRRLGRRRLDALVRAVGDRGASSDDAAVVGADGRERGNCASARCGSCCSSRRCSARRQCCSSRTFAPHRSTFPPSSRRPRSWRCSSSCGCSASCARSSRSARG